MIICGYAGIGKSYLAHNYPGVIDLESTPFEKDWDRYVKCAIHYHEQGYLVLLSCHKEVRERICATFSGVPYGLRITVVPNISDKELYKKRYIERGNTPDFIKTQMENWEKWLSEDNCILGEQWEEMLPGEHLYDALKRLSKEPPYRFCNYDCCPVCGNCSEEPRCKNPLSKFTFLK